MKRDHWNVHITFASTYVHPHNGQTYTTNANETIGVVAATIDEAIAAARAERPGSTVWRVNHCGPIRVVVGGDGPAPAGGGDTP